ncbi:hypothetical protein D3C80_1502340 [compost metagenome]
MIGTGGRRIGEAFFGFRQQTLQFLASIDDPALRRCPGSQSTAQRTHAVVGGGFLGRDFFHPPFDPHLALQRRPEEGHRRQRTGRHLLPLGAVVIAEEGETALVQPLEQQDAAVRLALLVHRGQGHGVRFDRQLLGLHRVLEPLVEQAERFGWRSGFAESITGVFAAHIGQGLSHRASPSEQVPKSLFTISRARAEQGENGQGSGVYTQ